MPAKAGIQVLSRLNHEKPDSRLRGNDDGNELVFQLTYP